MWTPAYRWSQARTAIAVDNWRGQSARQTAKNMRSIGVRDLPGVGRAIIHMSDTDQVALFKRYPEMDPVQNPDKESRSKAFYKWAKSSASETYRTGAKI